LIKNDAGKINKVKQSNNKVKNVCAKTPLAEVFYFLPGNGARKRAYGAKLTREVFFNLWKYSSLVPDNGARKRA
jgi:hypothetical protein